MNSDTHSGHTAPASGTLRGLRARLAARAALAALALTVMLAVATAPAQATQAGEDGPIAYVDTSGDVVLINADGSDQHVLVPASQFPGFRLEIASSGAWSAASDPELLLIAIPTSVCIDGPCGALPTVLYSVPETGGQARFVTRSLGVIQSASWYGNSSNEIIVSADNGSGASTGFQAFEMEELTLSPMHVTSLGYPGFDVDASSSSGYIVYSTGNMNEVPPTSASPSGQWDGCTTDFTMGLRDCSYTQSCPTSPPGLGTTAPCTIGEVGLPLDTDVQQFDPGVGFKGVAAEDGDYDYGASVNPQTGQPPLFVSQVVSPSDSYERTYLGSQPILSGISSAPETHWAFSPDGQDMAESWFDPNLTDGLLMVRATNDPSAFPKIIAGNVGLSSVDGTGDGGSVIAWASSRDFRVRAGGVGSSGRVSVG